MLILLEYSVIYVIWFQGLSLWFWGLSLWLALPDLFGAYQLCFLWDRKRWFYLCVCGSMKSWGVTIQVKASEQYGRCKFFKVKIQKVACDYLKYNIVYAMN